jgi:hypothetical protein
LLAVTVGCSPSLDRFLRYLGAGEFLCHLCNEVCGRAGFDEAGEQAHPGSP